MQLTLTYNDLIAAAQAHINKMGVTGEVVGVDLKVGRKDRTKTTMTITIGTPEAKQPAADVVVQTEQIEPVEELVEEVVVDDEETETSPEVVDEVVPRTGLFRGVN